MAVSTIDLYTLLNELPDPAIQLSPQPISPPLKAFTCFNKLSTEIRDLIWYHTLPGPRLIHLNAGPLGRKERHLFRPPPLPIVLHVNHESRSIALKHYHLLYHRTSRGEVGARPDGEPTLVFPRQLIAIASAKDTIYIKYFDMAVFDWVYDMEKLYKSNTRLFHGIKSLEIRGVRWSDITEEDHRTIWYTSGSGSCLKYFKGLEELHLIAFECEDTGDEEDDVSEYACGWEGAEDWEACVKAFQVRFKTYVKQGSSIPKIFLHSWRRIQVRDSEEDKSDAVIPYIFIEEDEVAAESDRDSSVDLDDFPNFSDVETEERGDMRNSGSVWADGSRS
jgi:hypothetical protein